MTVGEMEREFPGLIDCIPFRYLEIQPKKEPVLPKGLTKQYLKILRSWL